MVQVVGLCVFRELEGEMTAIKDFSWGPVVTVHSIGPYEIIEFRPQIFDKGAGTGRYSQFVTNFHPYVNGEDMHESFESLDAALAGAIAYRYEGANHHADSYFMKSIGAN